MVQPYLGEIRMFGGNFAPAGWAMCNGQLQSIANYTALFSLIGTTYGGDGQSTFGLPNLQSQFPMGQGNGPGLSPRVIGEAAGTEDVTLTVQMIPSHIHSFVASSTVAVAGGDVPSGTVVPGAPSAKSGFLYTVDDGTTPPPTSETLIAASCGPAGGNLPHTNLMPSLCVTFIIALQGIFPSRN